MQAIYIGSDNVVALNALTNAATGVAITAATVEATLYDGAGDPVAGQAWPATLAHAGSGTYRGALEDGLALTLGGVYRLVVEANAGDDLLGIWHVDLQAALRRA